MLRDAEPIWTTAWVNATRQAPCLHVGEPAKLVSTCSGSSAEPNLNKEQCLVAVSTVVAVADVHLDELLPQL